MMLTSSQWPGVLTFVLIDCTLLSMFCSWFVTLIITKVKVVSHKPPTSHLPFNPPPPPHPLEITMIFHGGGGGGGGGVWICSGTTQCIKTVEALLTDTLISGSSTYCHLHKTPLFSTLIKTLYFYIPLSSQPQLQTPFLHPEGVGLRELLL